VSAAGVGAAAGAPGGPVQRKGRNTELVLVFFAIGIAAAALASVELGVMGEVTDRVGLYTAVFAAPALLAHLVIRLRADYADPVLLPTVLALNGLGLAMIHRLDLARAEAAGDDLTASIAGRVLGQLGWSVLGMVLLMLVVWLVPDHRVLSRYTYLTFIAGVVLLLLPLIPGLGVEINGARIWVIVFGQSFQPGEAAKIALVVAFSSYLMVHADALALAGRRVLGLDLPRGRDLGPILTVGMLALAILVFQRDLGAAAMLFGVFVVLLFVATERLGWLVVGALMAATGVFVAYQLFGHVRVRVQAWLDPFADPDANFQIIQSLYGLAFGGIVGTGLGQGYPYLVPFAESDFITSALGEELGLTGLMAVIVLYGVLVARGLRAALGARDQFGTLLATGLATVVGLQVFVIVGGVTGLIPLTGLTTPFLSLGGSSLVMNWVLVALLVRVSDAGRRPPPPAPEPLAEALTQAVPLR
jgi:cell division protein FtsW (lipid II flippase)